MQKITIQSDFANSLKRLDEKVLLCDDTGSELGFFQPTIPKTIDRPLSIEETEKLRKKYVPGTGRTTDEVLKKWES